MENLMLNAKIQVKLCEVVNKNNIQKSCNDKDATFIVSKLKKFTILHWNIV